MSDEEPEELAPVFEVPDREVVAVEHPMIIHNVDNAIKTFGTNRPFLRVSSSLTMNLFLCGSFFHT